MKDYPWVLDNPQRLIFTKDDRGEPTNFYAGIGSRKTPNDIRELMINIAYKLADIGWCLRSGNAEGADIAFSLGVLYHGDKYLNHQHLYLPWPGYNITGLEDPELKSVKLDSPIYWAYDVAAQFHPTWVDLSQGAKRLHARNVHIIVGHQVRDVILVKAKARQVGSMANMYHFRQNYINPSSFVLCWAKDGALGTPEAPTSSQTGGTGMGIRLAHFYGIPVYNLARKEHRELWEKLL